MAIALLGTILGFALLIMAIPLMDKAGRIEAAWDRCAQRLVAMVAAVRKRIHEARNPTPREIDPDHLEVFVPAAAGPVVETPASPNPLPLSAVPVRSTKADAKRQALAYARQRTRNPDLPWKKARQLLNQWEREERAREREQDPEYVSRMKELEEASA